MTNSAVTIAWVQEKVKKLIPALAINASQASQEFAKGALSRSGLDHILHRLQKCHVLTERQDIASVDALLFAIAPTMTDVKAYLNETAELGEFDEQDLAIKKDYHALLYAFVERGFTERSLVLETPAHPDPAIAKLPLFESDKESYYDPLYALKANFITLSIDKTQQGKRSAWVNGKLLSQDILVRLTHAIRTGRARLDSETRDPNLECIYRHFTLKLR